MKIILVQKALTLNPWSLITNRESLIRDSRIPDSRIRDSRSVIRDSGIQCIFRPSTGSSSSASLLHLLPPGALLRRAAPASSTSEFFASGRAVPWWLAGLSMVATTFSSDTPNLVTDIVRRNGVAGNWVWWAFVLTGVATVFFYARLWRRSGVLTDLEFYEIRYSGKAAQRRARLPRRLPRAVLQLHDHGDGQPRRVQDRRRSCSASTAGRRLLLVGILNVVFAALSGLWGVLVIDMIQFFIKMTAVIAAAYFAVHVAAGRRAARADRARSRRCTGPRHQLPEPAARLQQQLGPRRRGVHHADRGAVVGRLVSGRRAGRRQLHRAAHARVEDGEGRARRGAVLQRRALRAAAVAVDPRRRSARSSSIRSCRDIQQRVSASRPAAARPRHRVSRDADVPAGRASSA